MCFCYNTRQSIQRNLHLELLGVLCHDSEHVLLRVEDARRAPELQPLLARDLGNRPLRRQVAVQDLRNTMQLQRSVLMLQDEMQPVFAGDLEDD